MNTGSRMEEYRALIRDAHSVLSSDIPPDEIDPLDPIESAIAFEERKKQWLFATAQKLSAMTGYQVSLLSDDEQRVRDNLISGSEGLLAIREQGTMSTATGLIKLRGNEELSTAGQQPADESADPTWSKIMAWGFGVCLATGLAGPVTTGSNIPAFVAWLNPELRNILLEISVYELGRYIGAGIGGAIVPAILVYGIYWGIRRLIKPRSKINWNALLGLCIAFGAMSVAGIYQSASQKVQSSTLIDANETPPLSLEAIGNEPQLSADEQRLIQQYRELNGQCRGGGEPVEVTQLACFHRDGMTETMAAANLCFGRAWQRTEAEMEWHRCGANSIREFRGHNTK